MLVSIKFDETLICSSVVRFLQLKIYLKKECKYNLTFLKIERIQIMSKVSSEFFNIRQDNRKTIPLFHCKIAQE